MDKRRVYMISVDFHIITYYRIHIGSCSWDYVSVTVGTFMYTSTIETWMTITLPLCENFKNAHNSTKAVCIYRFYFSIYACQNLSAGAVASGIVAPLEGGGAVRSKLLLVFLPSNRLRAPATYFLTDRCARLFTWRKYFTLVTWCHNC
jgi:hypothetical protein